MAMNTVIFMLILTVGGIFILTGGVAEAKRGCVNFGHSCFGGMGKRFNLLKTNLTILQHSKENARNPFYVLTGFKRFQHKAAKSPGLFNYYKLTPVKFPPMNKYVLKWLNM